MNTALKSGKFGKQYTSSNHRIIVTGAAGFLGYHLIEALSEARCDVTAIVRPKSEHNKRLFRFKELHCIEADEDEIERIQDTLLADNGCFIHLLWRPAGRYDYEAQMENAYLTLKAVELASRIGCKRFIGIGSQAEYGLTGEEMIEDKTPAKPFCAYGAAKTAACHMSKRRARELGMEWIWGRVFSVYGEYEPEERIIPSVMKALERGDGLALSSCRQNWDFLYGGDAGSAILALAEKGRDGEIYNIAEGEYRPLKSFVEDVEGLYGARNYFKFGDDPCPFVSLQPSVEKLRRDAGWEPHVRFVDGIKALMKM